MTTGGTSPTARRWELARRLKELRVQAGHSLEDVAQELMCSTAKISRMENGGRGIQPRDVRDLCRYYGVAPSVQIELLDLAKEAGRSGWWAGYRSMPEEMATFVGLESAAVEVRAFQYRVVPGLLQTHAYARHLLSRMRPEGELGPEVQHEWAEVRSRRQAPVLDGSLQLSAILDELALIRPPGPPEVIRDQVDELIRRAALPNVQLRVVPLTAGAYPGLDGNFTWMRFGQRAVADVVFVEGHVGMFLVDKPAATDRYVEIFEDIAARFALPPGETLAWLQDHRARLAA